MDTEHSYNLIPEGEIRCIWMDAGVVSYKLCDRGLECEGCPFDADVCRNHDNAVTGGRPQKLSVPDPVPQTFGHSSNTSEIISKELTALAAREVPSDRTYHRNHFWMQRLERDTLRLGIDHVAASLLRPVTSIVRPKTPATLRVHDPFCWLVVSKGTVTVPSPLDATLNAFNTEILDRPSLLDTDPYGDGWIAEFSIRPRGKGMSDWVSETEQRDLRVKQTKALAEAFANGMKHQHPGIGPTLYDGGTGISDIESIVGRRHYFEVISRIFRLPIAE